MSDPIARLNAALEGRYRIERQLGEGGMATADRSKLPLMATLAVFAAGTGGLTSCSDSLSFEPELRPDVSGSWSISFSGVHPGQTNGSDGVCELGSTIVELTLAGQVAWLDRYEGSSTGMEMRCSGLTPEVTETTGLRDTTIVFDADTVEAYSRDTLCFLLGSCTPPEVKLRFAGLYLVASFSWEGGAITELSGPFTWITSDTLRVRGEWRAERERGA